MTWLLIAVGVVVVLVVIARWRRKARRKLLSDPAMYETMADLYAVRRRLDVALFRQRLSRDMAEARRQLGAELDEP
jgi:hypothetical protein